MTKIDFLQQLYNHLASLEPTERDDIISDFEEHFSVGVEIGKTEEQICEELGNPYNCALQYLRQSVKPEDAPKQNYAPEKSRQTSGSKNDVKNNIDYSKRDNSLWAVMFFVLLFVALCVYPTSCGLMLASVGALAVSAFSATFFSSWVMLGLLISAAAILLCIGLLGFIIMTALLKMAWKRSNL